MLKVKVRKSDVELLNQFYAHVFQDKYVQDKIVEAMSIIETADKQASYMLGVGSGDITDWQKTDSVNTAASDCAYVVNTVMNLINDNFEEQAEYFVNSNAIANDAVLA
jgi:glycerol dehydrogenase-like iron-containing ADH family enzyme